MTVPNSSDTPLVVSGEGCQVRQCTASFKGKLDGLGLYVLREEKGNESSSQDTTKATMRMGVDTYIKRTEGK